MRALLGHLRATAEVVVVDAPPVLPVTDAVLLSTAVDAVVMVVRSGRTGRHQAVEARRRLDGVAARVVGHVLNGVPQGSMDGSYAAYAAYGDRRQRGESGRPALARLLRREQHSEVDAESAPPVEGLQGRSPAVEDAVKMGEQGSSTH